MAEGQSRLTVVPVTQADAGAFIVTHHRHHFPLKVGYVFCIAVADESGEIRGVAVVGRPCTRALWDGWTLEVRRVATDGCPNACSALYGAAWRVSRAMGYRRLVTYILASEPGISLNAAGWKNVGELKARKTWDFPSRPRVNKQPQQAKIRYEIMEPNQ
jgi:hypothetical protein